MRASPDIRPIAPLRRELLLQGIFQGTLGVAAFAASLVVIEHPLRALALFLPTAAVFGAGLAVRAGWFARVPAPPASDMALRESTTDTVRRTAVISAPALIVLIVALVVGAGLGALIAGVVVGSALGDLRGGRLAAREERELWRELGAHPFSGPRRPIYTRPRSASTLRT